MAFIVVAPSVFITFLILGIVCLCRVAHGYLLSVQTAINDLPALGVAKKTKIPGTAVVCGGSIGGLLTARVCHDHFERVIVVEPEAWLSTEEGRTTESWTQTQVRSRLIQYHACHASYALLYSAFKRLFPNLDDECLVSGIKAGAGDFGTQFGGKYLRVPYAQYLYNLPKTFYATRQALETLIRRLTLDPVVCPNIHQIAGTVVGVERDPSNPTYLDRVQVRTEDGVSDIEAVLVVDCTGSTQAGIKWLHRADGDQGKMSLDRLKVSFDPKMHYSTMRLTVTPSLAARLPPGYNPAGAVFLLVPNEPGDNKHFICFKTEANCILMCCGAWGSSDLPVNLAGIREHITSMKQPVPDWFWQYLDMLSEVEDTLSVACGNLRVPPSYWTHFENATDLPSNWIAIGDSVARLNPFFGQGCPKALLGVACLNTLLHQVTARIPPDFSHKFFAAQAAKIKPANYGMSTTTPIAGETLKVGSFGRWFSHHLQLLSTEDDQAGAILWKTQMMLDSTTIDALHPVLLLKVLLLACRRWWNSQC
ncbi:hypothetical protein BDZ89DRAFT_1019753 [Hymenopellis radicata]|nr:hypothetical protein BDZ89DRAFT_1019753 [Hymenopellis radicata]